MEPQDQRIIPINIEEEMKSSYIDYSMSVIVSRALPDVRDGLKPVHRRVLYSMTELGLSAGASYKKSARIVGECFVAGTRVLTDQGLRAIEDVERGDTVFTQSGQAPVTELYEMPPRPLRRVTLENGLSLTCTPAQPIKVLTDALTYEWKDADDLAPGDTLVVRADYPDGLPRAALPAWQGRTLSLGEDLAYLLGAFLSDGWVAKSSGRFCFYSTAQPIIARIRQTLADVFGYEATVEDKTYARGDGAPQSAYQIRIHRRALNNYLFEAFGIAPGADAATKAVPEPVLRSPKPVLAAFLSGLIDGDGSVHRTRNAVHYGTISEALAQDVQLILLHLGVLAQRFTQSGQPNRFEGHTIEGTADLISLEATGRHAQRLGALLDLAHPKKRDRLQRIRQAHVKVNKYDRIPHAGAALFGELSERHRGGGWYEDVDGAAFRMGTKYPGGAKIRYGRDLKERPLGRTQIAEWGLAEKLRRVGSERAAFVDDVLDHRLHFLSVASVEEAPAQKTYDLQVAGPHEFVANGIVSHNCLGKYHPHGDSSVYDTLVRLAQDFSMRYPLVDGQGNFGSVDGDAAAAMRYTEARMTRVAEEMLRDLGKETVDTRENFDATLQEPKVLPAAFPNMLVNGSDGIAVGMATKIPPHNLGEAIDAVVAFIDDPEIGIDGLMEHLPAPDFPTGGVIFGYAGVKDAYHTGRGRVVMRAKIHEEEIRPGRMALIATEIPYQVNKATLLEKVADLVKTGRIEGISDLRDESDRDGMRVVVELKRDAVPLVVQNKLFKFSQFQQTFGVNMVALVQGRPRVLTLLDAVRHYVAHRHEIVVRRTEYDLRKAQERAHILEGLTRALDHLDAVITIIRHSDDTAEARANLMAGTYPKRLSEADLKELGVPLQPPVEQTKDDAPQGVLALGDEIPDEYVPQPWLSEAQADAILALRLSRLTGMEREKILSEYRQIIQEIERLQTILGSRELRMSIIKDELLEVRERFDDARRTEIDYTGGGDIDMEDLIEDEHVVVTVTHQGLMKRTPITEYRQQGRGGVGVRGTGKRDDDYIEHLFTSHNHDYLLFFTDHGQCYWLRVYDIPEGSRTAKGRSIRNLIQIAPDDCLRAVLAVQKEDFEDEDFLNHHHVVMATRQGQVKKTTLEDFSRPRTDGIIAISVDEGDQLLEAHLTSGQAHVIMASSGGRAVRFDESDARPMGRNTRGVRGIRLGEGETVVGMITVEPEADPCLLAVSANGYGKQSPLSEYPVQGRGGLGVITLKTTKRTGRLVTIKGVTEEDDLMIITRRGTMIRMEVASISTMSRNTQGVRVINLKKTDEIGDVTRLVVDEEENAEGEDASEEEAAPAATNGQAGR